MVLFLLREGAMSVKRGEKRTQAGFTLIEILAVITIIGVLIMISLPKIESALRSAAADRASRVVANDMELAISSAARARRPMRVTFTSSTKTYTIADRAGTVIVTRPLGDGTAYNLSGVTFSPATFD